MQDEGNIQKGNKNLKETFACGQETHKLNDGELGKFPENNANISATLFSETTLKQALRLLGNIIYLRFNVEIKSLHFI